MNGTKIFDLMCEGDAQSIYDIARKVNRPTVILDAVKQYEPSLHNVASKSKRPDKKIFIPNGEMQPGTNIPIMVSDTAPVSRIPLPIQKYIISQKGSFARGNGVILKPTIEDSKIYDRVYQNWQSNKIDYDLKELAVRKMGETQVAVIFYGEKGKETLDDFKFRYKIVSPIKGDKLEPFFDDDTDDMIAFGREYKRGNNTLYDFYVMSKTSGLCEIWKYINKQPKMVPGTIVNEFGVEIEAEQHEVIKTKYTKLPVIYWEQDAGECDDTDALITEFETGFSDFCSQMGYSADPILFAKGAVMDMPLKGSPGKLIESSDSNADLKYVTPDNATESRDLQFRLLQKFIFSLNRAILLDLETLKGLGSGLSGAALERFLIDVYIAAADQQQGAWGKGVQRMANWLVSQWQYLEGIKEKGFRIDVVFTKYSLQDEAERVNLAVVANGGKPVIDLQGGVALAGLVDDSKVTADKIKGEVSPVAIPTPTINNNPLPTV